MTKKNNVDYASLVKNSFNYAEEQQDKIIKDFFLTAYPNFNINQTTGLFIWGDENEAKVEAEFEAVGSFSEIDNSWLWAWKNDTLEQKIKSEIIKVKNYGEQNKFEKLIIPYWGAIEKDGYEMAVISANILKAKGFYRIPFENGIQFYILFKDIRWVNK